MHAFLHHAGLALPMPTKLCKPLPPKPPGVEESHAFYHMLNNAYAERIHAY